MPANLRLFELVRLSNIGEYDIVVNLRTDIVNEIVRNTTGAQRRPSSLPR